MKDKRRVPGAVLALAGSLAVTAAVLTGCQTNTMREDWCRCAKTCQMVMEGK